MLRKREHGHTNVRKDKILRQKVEQFEDLFRSHSRIIRKIVVRVVCLTDSAKKYGHNTCKFGNFGNQKRAVRHQHEQC